MSFSSKNFKGILQFYYYIFQNFKSKIVPKRDQELFFLIFSKHATPYTNNVLLAACTIGVTIILQFHKPGIFKTTGGDN